MSKLEMQQYEGELLEKVYEFMGMEIPEVARGGRTEMVSMNTTKLYAKYLDDVMAKRVDVNCSCSWASCASVPCVELQTLDTFNRLVIAAEMHVPMYDPKQWFPRSSTHEKIIPRDN